MMAFLYPIGQFIDFFADKERTTLWISVAYCILVLSLGCILRKSNRLPDKAFNNFLKFFAFSIAYIGYVALVIATKRYLFGDLDKALFPELCMLVALFLMLALFHSLPSIANRIVSIIFILPSVFCSWILLLALFAFPLRHLRDGGHAPIVLVFYNMLFLLFASLFMGIRKSKKVGAGGRL